MNLGQVARILSGFTLFFALAQLPSLVWALIEEVPGHSPINATAGFGAGITIGLLVAGLLRFAGHRGEPGFYRKEALAVVGFAWLMAGALGAIPYQWSGAIPDGADAFFESVSGLTTTGASTLGTGANPAIEELPGSLLLWRSLTQWMGGLGIILVFVVLLPTMGVTGKNLLASEQVGVSKENLRPRMKEQARSLVRVYLLLTTTEFLLLLGMIGPFDALNHSFTTLATGGFSTRNSSIAAYDSDTVEWVVTAFMFLAGCNFMLLYGVFTQRLSGLRSLVQSSEFRLYASLTVGFVLVTAVYLRVTGGRLPDPVDGSVDYTSFWRCLQDAAFNVVSMVTATGYGTADFQRWPAPVLILLIFGMLIGGCAGSTAGGIKHVRLLVSLKLMALSVRHFIRPKSVERIRVDHEVLQVQVISGILTLVLLWIATVLVGTAVIAVDTRIDVYSAFTASVSITSCCGPSLTSPDTIAAGLDIGPYGGYGDLAGPTKLYMSLQMILGRLEILAPLALLAPAFWRR